MRRSIIALAGVAILLASGCGAGAEEDDAREVVKQYAAAIADGDERAACATLTKESRKQFKRSKTTCADAYKTFGKSLRREQKDKLRNLDPAVKVNGANASTKVGEPPLEGRLRLKKEGGRWKVSTE